MQKLPLSRRETLVGLAAAAPILILPANAVSAAAIADFQGVWSTFAKDGETEDSGTRVRITISFDGSGDIILLDQGNVQLNFSKVQVAGSVITLEIAAVGASFSGQRDGLSRIVGTFVQGSIRQPVTLTRGDRYAKTRAPLIAAPINANLVARARISGDTPAMAVGWAYRDERPRIFVDGQRASTSTHRVAASDAWHIGSNTKSMTASLVARLVEAGRLNWNMTIGQVMGRIAPQMHPAYRNVSLIQLLSHRSGLPREIDPALAARFTRGILSDARMERIAYARFALGQPPLSEPGTVTLYSNSGYVIVGAMLEAITGEPWEALMVRHIFRPLGLKSAGFGPPGKPGSNKQPLGHYRTEQGLRPATPGYNSRADLPVVMGPAGLVHINLGDLVTYLAAHRDKPAAFLSAASWQLLHTPQKDSNYALGWAVSPDGILGHDGSNLRWYAVVVVDPKSGLVCASAANAATPDAPRALRHLAESARLSASER
jgi:CubicO group peptidase (beta-lactamase class C family)